MFNQTDSMHRITTSAGKIYPGMLIPSYLDLLASRLLKKRVERAYERLSSCDICPRLCGINRLDDERGFCRTGLLPVVSSYGPHFGEEPPLVGRHGSGTIFFTHCNMDCAYCQNHSISQGGRRKAGQYRRTRLDHARTPGCRVP